MGSRCLAMRVRVLSSLFSFIVVQERRGGGERERERGRGGREGGREGEGESDSCFYLGCRCNALGPNAKCLGHTRFIQIDSALLSGNGLLKVNFRINSTTATRLFPSSASLGRRAFFFYVFFLFPSESSLTDVCLVTSNSLQYYFFVTFYACRRVYIKCMRIRVGLCV